MRLLHTLTSFYKWIYRVPAYTLRVEHNDGWNHLCRQSLASWTRKVNAAYIPQAPDIAVAVMG